MDQPAMGTTTRVYHVPIPATLKVEVTTNRDGTVAAVKTEWVTPPGQYLPAAVTTRREPAAAARAEGEPAPCQ